MRSLPALLLLTVLLLPAGCVGDEKTENPGATATVPGQESSDAWLPLEIPDASGGTIVLHTRPQRIISLVPSASEILVSLGAADRLVGRTDFDTSAALVGLPSVGGGLHPSPEALVALEPDLVIRFGGDSDAVTPRRLDQMGIPHLAIQPDGIQDVRRIIRDLGALAGEVERARLLLTEMDGTLSEIRERVRNRPRVRVGYLLGGSPPWVAGPGSYIEELLELAGGENVFSDLQGLFGPVNAEVFLVREIDLLLAAEGAEVSLPETGVPLLRLSPQVEIPGPHLADAAWEMARALHPEVFR